MSLAFEIQENNKIKECGIEWLLVSAHWHIQKAKQLIQFKTNCEGQKSSLADSYLQLEGLLSWWTDTELNCENGRTSEKAEFIA